MSAHLDMVGIVLATGGIARLYAHELRDFGRTGARWFVSMRMAAAEPWELVPFVGAAAAFAASGGAQLGAGDLALGVLEVALGAALIAVLAAPWHPPERAARRVRAHVAAASLLVALLTAFNVARARHAPEAALAMAATAAFTLDVMRVARRLQREHGLTRVELALSSRAAAVAPIRRREWWLLAFQIGMATLATLVDLGR